MSAPGPLALVKAIGANAFRTAVARRVVILTAATVIATSPAEQANIATQTVDAFAHVME
jgi:hypothetical protein